MIRLSFPDIAPVSADPQAPARTWLPQAAALVEGCLGAIRAGEPPGLGALLEASGAPALDVTVTLMSARAALLGLEGGRGFAQHELRVRPTFPEELSPELDVGGTAPSWEGGALAEPKYFSFFQDAPIPVLNPGHRRKWRAHELLHGAVGFLWSPGMSRFDCYLGARLGELLPVVHWYGLDELWRPRCPLHDGRPPARAYCQACEEAARPFWEGDEPWLAARRPAAEAHAQGALDHVAGEWDALREELRTGAPVEHVRGHLDASSDAVGYLRGHWNRLTAWSFGAWIEAFCLPGVDYHEHAAAMMEAVAGVARRLVSGTLELSPADAALRRTRRVLQDLGYRTLVAMEGWTGSRGDRAEALLTPILEEAGGLCAELWEASMGEGAAAEAAARARDLLPAWVEALDRVAPREPLAALGVTWPDLEALTGLSPEDQRQRGLPQLIDGLRQAAPLTAAAGVRLRSLALAFAASPHMGAGARLAVRLGRWAEDAPTSVLSAAVAERARFEGWLDAEPRQDEEAELFGALPDEGADLVRGGRLRPHRTLRRGHLSAALAAEVLGEAGAVDVAAVRVRGEPRILPLDDASAAALDALTSDQPPARWLAEVDPQVLGALLEHGFAVWLPLPGGARLD